MEKTRVELFELVWQTPMVHLSKQLNLSDVGLKKICQKHGIPLPMRGHWTRKQLGQEDPRPQLPYSNHNPVIRFPDEVQAEHNKSIGKMVKVAKLQAEVEPITRTIDQLHDIRCIRTAEAIKAFIKELEKKEGKSFSSIKGVASIWPPTNLFAFRYFYSRQEQIPIVATAKNAIRALCLADEIIERLEKQGIEVVLEPRHNDVRYELIAKKQRASCEIDFRETWTKSGITTSLKKLYRLDSGRDPWRDYIEVPKDILCVNLGGRYGRVINDTRLKLECQLDKIVEVIVKKLDDEIVRQDEWDARNREYERKKAIRLHNERIIEDQEHQYEIALKESERFASHQRLQEYLLLIQGEIARLPKDQQVIGQDWLELVRVKMIQKDPISKRMRTFSSILQEGSEQVTQYWHEQPISENYDPEFEDDLREDRYM